MKTLYVYADFEWLDEPMLVGELGYESQGHRHSSLVHSFGLKNLLP